MLRDTHLIWDGWIYGGGTVVTSTDWAEPLARHDFIALDFRVTNLDVAGNLSVTFAHSGDGINYVQKQASLSPSLSINAENSFSVADTTGQPTLHLFQLQLAWSGGPSAGRVKVYAALRDRAKQRGDGGRSRHITRFDKGPL